MAGYLPRTDLAVESREIVQEQAVGEISGVDFKEDNISGINFQLLEILDDNGSKELGKPKGKYCTVDIDPVMRRDAESFPKAAEAAAELIRRFLSFGDGDFRALVVGLGNRLITPDAIGPLASEAILVTRHLKQLMPEDFAAFQDVSVITPGVLGTSGIESADYVKCICDSMKPDFVIVVDALAARGIERLCHTLQITDTGITPGSGVGNSRSAISSETLGVPVLAIGVPTVVDIRSLLSDYGAPGLSAHTAENNEMIVTPREIDSQVACVSRLVGYSVNLALHKGLTMGDIDMLLG